jgi:hypothetical protein
MVTTKNGDRLIQWLKGHDGMNDYFLRILIQEQHKDILAEVRAAQLSKLERSRFTPGNKSIRRVSSFFSKCKSSVAFKPQRVAERRTS